jgi:hypothetical protein
MRHFASPRFWKCYHKLPGAARVGSSYRVLAMPVADGFIWFWIGTHREYEMLLERP